MLQDSGEDRPAQGRDVRIVELLQLFVDAQAYLFEYADLDGGRILLDICAQIREDAIDTRRVGLDEKGIDISNGGVTLQLITGILITLDGVSCHGVLCLLRVDMESAREQKQKYECEYEATNHTHATDTRIGHYPQMSVCQAPYVKSA